MTELIKCLIMSAYAAWTVHGMYRTMIPKPYRERAKTPGTPPLVRPTNSVIRVWK